MKVIAVFMSFCLLSVVALAQAGPVKSFESTKGIEISSGYSMLHDSGGIEHGISATVQGHINNYLSGVVDVGGYSQHGLKTFIYAGGPQLTYRKTRYQPFARLLVGGTRLSYDGYSFNGFVYGGGGGLDIRLNHGLALRVSEDFIHNRDLGNVGKMGLGISYRFSH